jgi:hypothetical protein
MTKEETSVKVSEEIKTLITKIKEEKKLEFFKEAHEFLVHLGYQTYEKAKENIEKGIEQSIQIREPIAEPINAEEPSETQIPCLFGTLVVRQTKNGLEYLAYCDNPQKTNLPKDRLLPTLACQKCYQRQIGVIKNFRQAFLISAYCGTTGDLSDPEHIERIPCLKDPNWDFRYSDCKECALFSKEIRKLILQNFS